MNPRIFSPEWWQNSLLLLPILLMSFAYHEYAHAYAAYRLGDKTAKEEGRLTTSPFRHIDLLGFLAFFIVGFGWAKPVHTDPSNFKNPRRDNAIVALAGPLANLGLAIFFNILLFIFKQFVTEVMFDTNIIWSVVQSFLLSGILYNIIFFVFNLIPLPPLDGSHILFAFLPGSLTNYLDLLNRIGRYLLLFLVFTDYIGYILWPVVNFFVKGLLFIY